MTSIFEKTYRQVQEAKKEFEIATDEAGKEVARKSYKAALKAIEDLGGKAIRIWSEYETSRNSGNEYLNIDQVVWDKDVEELISCMRENGIERFTFSSGWTDAVETAWLFQKAGCVLEGLVEINKGNLTSFTDECEKIHGYLFRV